MSAAWARREFWVELASDKPGVISELDHLDQALILRPSRDRHTLRFKLRDQRIVHFVAVAVPFSNHIAAVDLTSLCAINELAWLRTKAHGSTHVRVLIAHFDIALLGLPLCDKANHRVRCFDIHLG